MRQDRVRLAFLSQDFRVERGLEREMLEQKRLGNGCCGRHALGRGAGKAVAGKTALGRPEDELPAQIAGHAKRCHLVSKHSPTTNVKKNGAAHAPEQAERSEAVANGAKRSNENGG